MDRLHKSNRYLLHFICHPLVKQKAILEYFYLIFHFFSQYITRRKVVRGGKKRELQSRVSSHSPQNTMKQSKFLIFHTQQLNAHIISYRKQPIIFCCQICNPPSLQILNTINPFWGTTQGRVDRVWSNLIYWRVSLPTAVDWNLQSLFQPKPF